MNVNDLMQVDVAITYEIGILRIVGRSIKMNQLR